MLLTMNGTASGKEAMAHAQFRTKDLISDLAQLETLHDEADKLKCIGNKQMAQQDYEKALESYSKAIQLSPSGPQSHVFYSNRAAACLSLKNYAEAVHDATRSTVLNPEFSKGYARLGQALYFSKRYEEAITAYERALELDNGQEGEQSEITLSYLNKARSKLEKRKNKTETSSTSATKKKWTQMSPIHRLLQCMWILYRRLPKSKKTPKFQSVTTFFRKHPYLGEISYLKAQLIRSKLTIFIERQMHTLDGKSSTWR